MGTAAEFERELMRKKEETVQKFVQLHRSIALDAFRMIAADTLQTGFQYGSPIWSGRYRSNHNISVGNPDFTIKPPNPETVGPGATRWPDQPETVLNAQPVAQAAVVLNALKPFDVAYITNPLPYARRIETGWSQLAPEGVYEVTAQAVQAKYQNVTLEGIQS